MQLDPKTFYLQKREYPLRLKQGEHCTIGDRTYAITYVNLRDERKPDFQIHNERYEGYMRNDFSAVS